MLMQIRGQINSRWETTLDSRTRRLWVSREVSVVLVEASGLSERRPAVENTQQDKFLRLLGFERRSGFLGESKTGN